MADLIDRAELLEWLTSHSGFRANCEYCTSVDCLDCIVEEAIKNAPSVEAAPVAHGRWVHVPSSDMMTGKAYKCSECGKMRYGSYMPNYCGNCGAKMDSNPSHTTQADEDKQYSGLVAED